MMRAYCVELERCLVYRATASTIRPTYAAWMLHIYVCESGWLGPRLGEEVSFVA